MVGTGKPAPMLVSRNNFWIARHSGMIRRMSAQPEKSFANEDRSVDLPTFNVAALVVPHKRPERPVDKRSTSHHPRRVPAECASVRTCESNADLMTFSQEYGCWPHADLQFGGFSGDERLGVVVGTAGG